MFEHFGSVKLLNLRLQIEVTQHPFTHYSLHFNILGRTNVLMIICTPVANKETEVSSEYSPQKRRYECGTEACFFKIFSDSLA